MSAQILLVEDDPALGFVIQDGLIHKGYEVTLCRDGEEGLQAFNAQPFDACILDVMMPKKDGFTLAHEIRAANTQVPILFVTAKSMLEDKLQGFRTGGDDYITKPFSLDELSMRLDVFLRRTSSSSYDERIFQIGLISFDPRNFILHHASRKKTLTPKEAEVMKLLCLNRERVLKREEILKTVWGDDDYFMGRSLDVFISKLRKYLKDDPSVEIVNYHGVGFKLVVNG
ncbi:MAG: response regulator transcription factor [Bacteroidetes bacterium]|nr:response regulator transcription factor [Bacteroidota bacterium]